MLKLTRRDTHPVPLDVAGITPDRVAGLSPLDVAKLPVLHGNRREELGQHFDLSTTRAIADLHFAGDTSNVKHLGAGTTGGSVFVEGAAGMHAGAGMTGGTLTLDADGGDWLGAEMKGGTIEVRGDAGHQLGAAYRGSRAGMTGGTIVVRGDCGDEAGLLMRRGLIVVGGRCGAFAGASMIAGSLIVLGRVGSRAGAEMKRGTVVAGGGCDGLPPSLVRVCVGRPTFLPLWWAELVRLGLALPESLRGTDWVTYRGDLLTGGRGEVLVPTAAVG